MHWLIVSNQWQVDTDLIHVFIASNQWQVNSDPIHVFIASNQWQVNSDPIHIFIASNQWQVDIDPIHVFIASNQWQINSDPIHIFIDFSQSMIGWHWPYPPKWPVFVDTVKQSVLCHESPDSIKRFYFLTFRFNGQTYWITSISISCASSKRFSYLPLSVQSDCCRKDQDSHQKWRLLKSKKPFCFFLRKLCRNLWDSVSMSVRPGVCSSWWILSVLYRVDLCLLFHCNAMRTSSKAHMNWRKIQLIEHTPAQKSGVLKFYELFKLSHAWFGQFNLVCAMSNWCEVRF